MPRRLRIGTWNVEYALKASTNLRRRALLQRYPADVWILTETRDTLRPNGRFFAAHSQQRPYYGKSIKLRSRWVTIWSRYPIIARPRCDDPERTTAAMIRTPLGPLLVYGTVMPWNGDKGRSGENQEARGWSEFFRVVPNQAAEWRALQRRYACSLICVAGDFNMDMGTGSYYGTRAGIALLNESLRAIDTYCPTAADERRRFGLKHPPIDHIAVPSRWRLGCRVVSAWEGRRGKPRMSDHSGLVVEVSVS